ncbi:hypothetical protein WG66_014098 [Moniliophthora roreri]|nr:hypothetical protein WG66_014098 [Moniliophthora roreri]
MYLQGDSGEFGEVRSVEFKGICVTIRVLAREKNIFPWAFPKFLKSSDVSHSSTSRDCYTPYNVSSLPLVP